MKRWFLLVLTGVMILLAFSFSGCGGSPVDEEAVAEEPETAAPEEEATPEEAVEEEAPSPEEEEAQDEEAVDVELDGQAHLEALVAAEPALAYMDMSMDEIESAFGPPSMEGDWRGAYFLTYDQENMLFWFDYPGLDQVIGVGFLNYQQPGQDTLLELPRGITFAEIREELGEPGYEGIDESDEIGGYLFVYETEQHIITISSVDDTPGVAGYLELLTRYEWR